MYFRKVYEYCRNKRTNRKKVKGERKIIKGKRKIGKGKRKIGKGERKKVEAGRRGVKRESSVKGRPRGQTKSRKSERNRESLNKSTECYNK